VSAREPLDEIPESLVAAFREEAAELLVDMEGALMALEASPGDEELVGRSFRALHTIKGNAAMFGFVAMERFAHELEHLFDLVRKKRMAVTGEIVGIALAAKDCLQELLAPGQDCERDAAGAPEVRRRLEAVLAAAGAGPAVVAPRDASPASSPGAPGDASAEPGVTAPRVDEEFLREVAELLQDLEVALMELERQPGDGELMLRAFRALHAIRGDGAKHGLVELQSFVAELEAVFEQLHRSGEPASRELIDLTLEACERMCRVIDGAGSSAAEIALREREIEKMHSIAARRTRPEPAVASGPRRSWRIRLRPGAGVFTGGTDPVAILDGLRALGACAVRGRFDEVPSLEELDPAVCHLWWEIEIATEATLDTLRDAFIYVGGADSSVEITPVDVAAVAAPPAETGAQPTVASAPAPAPAAAAESGEKGKRPAAQVPSGGGDASTLRVGAGRLDALVNLVGELVTVQARLSREAQTSSQQALVGIAEEVERLTADLRDLTLEIRMVPVRPVFGKFRRLVRDLAQSIGREVELTTEGEETELDKSVIDRLGDPIVHILRNCIDHGIETPEERERAGKPRKGSVLLTAAQAGPSVVIRIEDDGRGIDLEAVRRKAVERGLLGEHEVRGERELHALLFAPGFSTSSRVTNVSGRGVGLDVVKRAVEGLRGEVRVVSRAGAGTAFEVRLPLTLAITEGLAVAVGEERYILPLSVVRECVEIAGRPDASRRLSDVASVRGEVLPYVRLRELLGVAGAPPPLEQVVVVESSGRTVGFAVDYVLGGHQTVIKPLGRIYRDVRWLAGSTILGDGTVALILDVDQLVSAAEAAGGGGAPC
jgi:two-component system chemotaxis sensor kinase CheA